MKAIHRIIINMSLFLGLLLAGCAKMPVIQEAPPTRADKPGSEVETSILAGRWAYQEAGFSYTLILDREGKGRYDWQRGRFVTTGLDERVWQGTWHQPGNDREGGFEIQLAPDFMKGEGRWWYTRIGDQTDPIKPGGTFRLRRLSPPTQALKSEE